MKNKQRWIIAFFLFFTVCFIWGNSSFSQADSAEQSSGLLEWIRNIFISVGAENSSVFLFIEKYIRKLAHFSEYFLLGGESVLFFFIDDFRFSLQKFWNAFSFSVLIAVTDESIQIISGRGPMVQDILIDSLGAFCGIFCMVLGKIFFTYCFRKKTEKNISPNKSYR